MNHLFPGANDGPDNMLSDGLETLIALAIAAGICFSAVSLAVRLNEASTVRLAANGAAPTPVSDPVKLFDRCPYYPDPVWCRLNPGSAGAGASDG